MDKSDKLKEAVELSIKAGYQINKEAFEFLNIISATEDPAGLVTKAIHKIDGLKKKTVFIDRNLLEDLLEGSKPIEKESLAHPLEDAPKLSTEPSVTGGKRQFHPYAEEVEPELDVIQDPTDQLNSRGMIEDYLQHFRDRFKRIERLLRRRVDVRSASSIIDALKASAKTRLKIIAMITSKRESKGRVLLTVEDLQSRATVLVSRNASPDLLKKAAALMCDQVVCLTVTKTQSKLLIAENIILPDVAGNPRHKAEVPVHAVLTSDMHIGSTQFQKEVFNRFILWLNGKYGNEKMRELAGHVKYVLIAGDIVDGVGIYPNQIEELTVKDIYKQYELAGNFLEQIPDYIEVIIIPGNHDAARKALPQPALSGEFLESLQQSRKIHSQGNPCYLRLHNVEVLLYHGRSLEDVISTVPGMEHNSPERAMTILLKSRHLAPIYGGKTLFSPESRDCLIIERIPDIFHSGHIHTLRYSNYRGVLVVNSGCWQGQTSYMRRYGFVPTPGIVPVVNLHTLETTIVPFT